MILGTRQIIKGHELPLKIISRLLLLKHLGECELTF